MAGRPTRIGGPVSWLLEELTAAEPTRTAYTPVEPGAIPLGRAALAFVANGAPMGEQRTESCKAARNYLSAGYDVDATAEALWRGLQQSPNDPACPWTRDDALAIARDIAGSPPTPLRPLEHGTVIVDTGGPRRGSAQVAAPDPPDLYEPAPDDDEGDGPEHFTDGGNAGFLVRRYGRNFRFVPGRGFFVWTGQRWARDVADVRVHGLAQLAVRDLYRLAADEPDDSRRKSLAAHAKTSDSAKSVRAMVQLARSLPGVAVHNEFALVMLPAAPSADRAETNPAVLERLYVQSPMARVSPEAMAISGVFGPVAAMGSEFPQMQRAVRDGMLGYGRSIERYGDYGWAIYGNTHSEELMNPAIAGVPGGRPSLHRVWNNNHYQHVSTSWRLAALDGDPRLWAWARLCSDNYASIGQVRYDALRGHVDGNHEDRAGPAIKYHNPGAFWHCKALVPWGGRDYGMDTNDADSELVGHWPDPSGLLFAWLMDANRWAKDGYDLWRKNVKFPTRGTKREINTTLVHAITAYEYEGSEETLTAIKGMARSLSSVPIDEQHPGPLWEPTWLSRYYDLAPDDEGFKEYLLASADAVGVANEGIWSLALSATAYQITGKDEYLRRHAGTLARTARQVFYDPDPDKRWDKYGFGPGPNRDHHFMLQWPRFALALREAKIDSLPAPDEPGHYFCGPSRHDNPNDIKSRGTRILLWRDKEDAFGLNVQATTLSSGDIQATSLEVMPPRGSPLLSVTRLPMSAAPSVVNTITRPSSWQVATETYTVPQSERGLHSVMIGSNQIGVFQGLIDGPECQVLINSKPRNGDPVALCAKLTRGYLVPLVRTKIGLTFTAEGTSDGTHVQLQDAKGKLLVNQFLRAGSSVSVTVSDRGANAGPWLLDAFSDHSGYFRLAIDSEADEPILYGRRLEDIEIIRQKLGK